MRRQKAAKRLKLVESVRRSSNRPEWMILEVIPVLPPGLRRWCRSMASLRDLHLNDSTAGHQPQQPAQEAARPARSPRSSSATRSGCCRRRWTPLLTTAAPPAAGSSDRLPTTGAESLSDTSRQEGRFRQNLLGKRVDYSGRLVIVVGPSSSSTSRAPKKMRSSCSKPFVYQELSGASSPTDQDGQGARRLSRRRVGTPQKGDRQHPVLLQRAPTLHRLGIQALERSLSRARRSRIPPLVCAAYNATSTATDAVHVPLSPRRSSRRGS